MKKYRTQTLQAGTEEAGEILHVAGPAQFHVYLAAEVERVLKEAKQLAQFLVDLGFQTESTELNLTTPEFTEVWKQAQRLLERLR